MFGLRNKERELYERLLAERERLIEHLATSGGTYFQPAAPAENTIPGDVIDPEEELEKILADQGLSIRDRAFETEDEAEIRWQVRNGATSPEAAAAFLQALEGSQELDSFVE